MIVNTMSLDEIGIELDNDHKEMWQKELDMYRRDMTGHFIKLIKSYPYYYIREMTSSRRNHYLVRVGVLSKNARKLKEQCPVDRYAVRVEPGKGHYVYIRGNEDGKKITIEYQPHFFHRYIERTGFKGSSDEAVKSFLKNNTIGIRTIANFEGKKYIVSPGQEGLCLGIIEKGNQIYKTFVSYDLLFPEQKEFENHWIQIKNLIDEFHSHYTAELSDRILSMAEDFQRQMDMEIVKLWEGFARYSLGKEVYVYKDSASEFTLVERGKRLDEIKKHPVEQKPDEETWIEFIEKPVEKESALMRFAEWLGRTAAKIHIAYLKIRAKFE